MSDERQKDKDALRACVMWLEYFLKPQPKVAYLPQQVLVVVAKAKERIGESP